MSHKETIVNLQVHARIDAFFKEFPFLHRYVARSSRTLHPGVKRVDNDLLNRQAGFNKSGGEVCSFYLIDGNGQEVAKLLYHPVLHVDTDLFEDAIQKLWIRLTGQAKNRTVFETIQMLDSPDRVSCILEVQETNNLNWSTRVIVHRVPSDWRFSDWLTKIREDAAGQLRNELDAINRV